MKICLCCEGVTPTTNARCGTCGAWLVPADEVHYPQRAGEADAANPFLGSVIDGKYRLQAVLGRGGLGTVFRAQHTGSLLPVALKLLHPRFAEHPEYRRLLLAEARRAASVMHDGCARLLDVGETADGVAYLAMELVDGETLEAVVQGGLLPAGHVVEILAQVVDALAAIHAAGLVHCDLSPRNVMVAARGGRLRVKVLDFGIARTVSLAGGERTRRSELLGFFNPVFSAPELLAGGDVGVRADFYSVGVLGRLLLTGTLPAAGDGGIAAGRGLPRRLTRLLQRCAAAEPADRPANAAAIAHELAVLRGARARLLPRLAVAAAALAVVANLLVQGAGSPPFLRLRAGSPIALVDPSVEAPVQQRRSAELATLGFHFGGFRAASLRIEVSRDGAVLLRAPLRPEVDATGDGLTLSSAQPQWRDVLASIVDGSRQGPLDLTFVAAGSGPLASARLRLDDDAPVVSWSIDGNGDGELLTGRARLAWHAEDLGGVAEVAAIVNGPAGAHWRVPLEGAKGEIDCGRALAVTLPGAAPTGPFEFAVVAVDPAGNASAVVPRRFAAVDVAAPVVIEVGGPNGEPHVPCLGGRARLRLRLSDREPGCRLAVARADGALHAEAELAASNGWQVVEVPLAAGGGTLVSGDVRFAVVDPAGNRSERSFALVLRDQDLGLRFTSAGPQPFAAGSELVFGTEGAIVHVHTNAGFELAAAALEDDAAVASLPLVARGEGGAALLTVPPRAPGPSRLVLTFADVAAGDAPMRTELPVRILPPAIEVRVPAAGSRFLTGLLQAGVLARSPQGLREGPGWRIDAEWLAYLRGTLWVGDARLVPLALPQRRHSGDALLPEVLPIPGHNVFALELRDVLGRPVRVFVGDEPAPMRATDAGSAAVVADFWWHDGAPLPIGEALLVEHGQPARLRVRLPLQYRPEELPDLRLGIAQSELAAVAVTAETDGCVVRFDLPFATWAAAAGLADVPRDRYGARLERACEAYLATPLGRHDLRLRIATTRSTLQPLQLGELATLPAALAALRLLPVLAPEQEFVEPLSDDAPPRAMFRPQVATAVRNLGDLLLQDREFTWGQARALLELAAARPIVDGDRLVHADDPLGVDRLAPSALLPALPEAAFDEAPVTDVDFFQAYACCRLLGRLVVGDEEAFRLPMGCELELAAYGAAVRPACHGAAAAGGGIRVATFRSAASFVRAGRPVPAGLLDRAGDRVAAAVGGEFSGLDFGVREWVFDLPHVGGAELLLREWIGDHAVHLEKSAAFARGAAPPTDLAGTVRAFGVVRGLGLGEESGLLDRRGDRIPLAGDGLLPPSVPGVLRTEQLRRDGRDLLSDRPDPRLRHTGFRLVGGPVLLLRLRGGG